MVNFLTAKVPDIDPKGITTGMIKIKTEHFNTLSRFFWAIAAFEFEGVIGVDKFIRKACLSSSTFADDQEFGFIDIVVSFFLPLPQKF